MKVKKKNKKQNVSPSMPYSLYLFPVEPDGVRQISPESPVKTLGEMYSRKVSASTVEVASSETPLRLSPPKTRSRRLSEPHPRYVCELLKVQIWLLS